jgi:predicted aspartyl protease
MGLIYKDLEFVGTKGSKVMRVLMDTGASESFLRESEAQAITDLFQSPVSVMVELGKGFVAVAELAIAAVNLDGHRVHWTFYVLEDLTEEAVIGADFFQRWKIKLDPATEDLIVDPQALKLKLV